MCTLPNEQPFFLSYRPAFAVEQKDRSTEQLASIQPILSQSANPSGTAADYSYY
jgi:hypothetical protein